MASEEEKFETRGKFLCRDGPARNSERYAQKKLCFTTTRRELLERHLLALSGRIDCVFVKLSLEPRNGMYVGRCFLTTEQAVGDVWAQYKHHPSLCCTVQDDDFVAQFRALSDTYDELWVDDDTPAFDRQTIEWEPPFSTR